jgi:hypothetical protein
MGVTRLLAALGGALVVAGIYLAWGLAPALIMAGVSVIVFAVLLVEVPERPEHAEVPEPGAVPLGSAGASRAGR